MRCMNSGQTGKPLHALLLGLVNVAVSEWRKEKTRGS